MLELNNLGHIYLLSKTNIQTLGSLVFTCTAKVGAAQASIVGGSGLALMAVFLLG